MARRATELALILVLPFLLAACSTTGEKLRVLVYGNAVVVSAQVKQLGDVPYLEITPPSPRRTILYVHGGPAVPTLSKTSAFELFLAARFSARVIKPAYYGSAERPNAARPVTWQMVVNSPKNDNIRRVTAAYRDQFAGSPRAVREVRRFVERWDGPNTVIVGDSFGSMLAALAAQGRLRSKLVLVAPQLATTEEFFNGAMRGDYVPASMPGDLALFDETGRNLAPEIFDTPESAQAFRKVLSLAYYEPWHRSDFGSLLRDVQAEATVIVGLKDRIGMVTGREWERLRANAPPNTRICLDPDLGHDLPNESEYSRACLERAVLGTTRKPPH